MTAPHRIPDEIFDQLASGDGGPEAVLLLRRARRSRNLLQLRRVLDGPCGPAAAEGAELLAHLERTVPNQVSAVLDSPAFGTWAGRVARDCPGHGRDGTCTARSLGALAAVAAIHAGVEATVTVPVHDGLVRLPGLGTARPTGSPAEARVVNTDAAVVEIRADGRVLRLPHDPARTGRGWLPVAVLHAAHGGLELRLPLETADPLLPALPADRVGPAAWQELLSSAWELLAEDHPRQAEALVAGVTGIVPLPAPARGVAAATSRHAFGTVLASWPAGPQRLALTMLHEFQHSKLSALMDLVPLHERGGPRRLYAPWRPDPRPSAGVLHGVYAHLADLAFWQRRSTVEQGAEQADAAWRYARTRAHLERGMAELAAHVRLTGAGERFVAHASAVVGAAEPGAGGAPGERLHRAVARMEAGREAAWRLRWAVPDATEVARLAARLLADRPADALPASEIGHLAGPVSGEGAAFVRWAARQRGADSASPLRSAADEVARHPGRVEAWADLAAAAAEQGADGAPVLRLRTELVQALLLSLAGRTAAAPDPLSLAAWLAGPEQRTPQNTGQNTGVSMSQSARSPLANTSATG
ncbi:aKG-HExxH-type peptide beta-hydroxylase [Streptomyces ureilyticus]|uniref:HEXXH motif domain-containing protein n=1 Tax=Streptomyces ureilyticus TaxID=1775131 RepID=A0ABX0E5X9_9ACTN|nr:HEXXH motif-containing putative peptide modification protein [Streptomyces ureilyticus]NGO47963.1 hypothetical protein [Streptomyces ureilyticus]